MTIVVGLILGALALALVAYPLFKQSPRPTQSLEDEQLRELHSRRDAIYSAIKELEFDFKSGSLSAEDYHDLEASYKSKAISILKDIDDFNKGSRVEDEVERQVIELRRAKGLFCSQCGARRQRDDRFCPHCGTKLSNREAS